MYKFFYIGVGKLLKLAHIIIYMENIVKILFSRGFMANDLKITLYDDKKIMLEVIEPKIFISMDCSKERIQYYISYNSPLSSKLISKAEIFELLKNIKPKKKE